MGIVNPNSPLIWDFRMTDALIAWAEAKQPIVVTPFLLAGATSAVSVAGGLAQQVAEALSGVALAQLVREGVPCLYGSFFTVTDMRTGSPAFGTPESVWGILAGAQLARRYGLPFRGGGGLASSPAVDAQAAAETADDALGHEPRRDRRRAPRRRMARGRAHASFEKFALDVELLRQFQAQAQGIGFTDEELAFDALKEAGPGGLFLASPHTRAHFKEWLYMSPLFSTPDFATWEAMGSETTEVAANRVEAAARVLRGSRLDPAIDEELQAYMASRHDAPILRGGLTRGGDTRDYAALPGIQWAGIESRLRVFERRELSFASPSAASSDSSSARISAQRKHRCTWSFTRPQACMNA